MQLKVDVGSSNQCVLGLTVNSQNFPRLNGQHHQYPALTDRKFKQMMLSIQSWEVLGTDSHVYWV